MPAYRVEVATASHDDLHAGYVETRLSMVSVSADSDTDAVLIACQMAACTSGAMPTRALLLDFPTD